MTSPPQGPLSGPPPGPEWGPIPTSGLPPDQRPRKKRRKWPWIAAGVVLALLVIAGIAGANSPKPTSATLGSPTPTTAASAVAASTTTTVSATTQPTTTAAPATTTAPQPPTTVPTTPLPTTTVPTTPITPAIVPQQPPPAFPAAPPVAVAPIPPPPQPAPSANLCGAPPNPYGYNYCGRGVNVSNPPGDVCTYFTCIANFPNGKGYMEECRDGTISKSGGIQGSCSKHGGDQRAITG